MVGWTLVTLVNCDGWLDTGHTGELWIVMHSGLLKSRLTLHYMGIGSPKLNFCDLKCPLILLDFRLNCAKMTEQTKLVFF